MSILSYLIVKSKPHFALSEYSWTPPGDKSISQRASILASLATGRTRISGFLWSEDTVNNLRALLRLGVRIKLDQKSNIIVHGVGLRGIKATSSLVYLGNSATSSRLMLAILSGQNGTFIVDGNPVLRRRPMDWIVEPLRDMGAGIEWIGQRGTLPVRVNGNHLRGRHHRVRVASAQAVSALLYAGLLADSPNRVYRLAQARDHTERLFRYLGIQVNEKDDYVEVVPPSMIPAEDISVPGDISSAAFAIALIAMEPRPGLSLTVRNVGLNPTRIGFLKVLSKMGADLEIVKQGIICGEPVGEVTIRSGKPLKGVHVSGASFVQSLIDEIPYIAVLATQARGATVFTDSGELKDKDTHRGETTCRLLGEFGIETEQIKDGFIVHPGNVKSPGTVTVPNDHRIAMAAMLLASRCDTPTRIENWEVVRISFPSCLEVLSMTAEWETNVPPIAWGPHMLLKEGLEQ